jgi:hypothetical protein
MPKYEQVIPLSLSETRLCRKNAVRMTANIGDIDSRMIIASGNIGDAFLFNGHLGIYCPHSKGYPKNHSFLRLSKRPII